MKTTYQLILIILFFSNTSLFAQQVSWQVPERSIRLLKGETTLAKITPYFYEHTAELEFNNEVYLIDFKNGSSRCLIYDAKNQFIGQGRKLKSNKKVLSFLNSNDIQLQKVGKKKQFYFQINPQLKLKFDRGRILLEGETTINHKEAIAQAILIYVYFNGKRQAERSSDTYFYPIIIPQ